MKPIHPAAPRPRWPFTCRQIVGQVVVAAVILASGIGIGVGGTILSLKGRIIRPPLGEVPPGPPGWLIDRWRADLNLTDVQVQKIKDMFAVRMTAAREKWEKMMELQRQELEEFVASMKSILTPDQFAKWHKEFTEHTERFGRRGPRGPGGPGGPGERMGRPDGRGGPEHRGDPNRPGFPGDRRNHGDWDMKGPNGPAPDGPPPQDSPPSQ